MVSRPPRIEYFTSIRPWKAWVLSHLLPGDVYYSFYRAICRRPFYPADSWNQRSLKWGDNGDCYRNKEHDWYTSERATSSDWQTDYGRSKCKNRNNEQKTIQRMPKKGKTNMHRKAFLGRMGGRGKKRTTREQQRDAALNR